MAATRAVVSLLVLSLLVCSSSGSIPDILNALYTSTSGPTEWIINKGWGTADPICTWWGVSCSTSGSTFNLSLIGNGLTGTIPNSLGQLGTSITSLLLDENRLEGTIPASLTNLTKLTQFDISQNNLTGTVPTGFGNLTGLHLFWISDNLLTGYLPDDLAPILKQVVAYQRDQGCRLAGNNFCCDVPSWVPTQCGMGCQYNTSCEVLVKPPFKSIKF
eukprot:Phypoly_transcript_14613.p1 GENE.Phypoly_transcript_14613~~Phypoly_transcript_14613.p1  ORF type:complete len:217 (+),score=28.18 Phypoly_transcript_14613:312-962(+)